MQIAFKQLCEPFFYHYNFSSVFLGLWIAISVASTMTTFQSIPSPSGISLGKLNKPKYLQLDEQVWKLLALKSRNSSQREIKFGIPANSSGREGVYPPHLTLMVCLELQHASLNRCISSEDYARIPKSLRYKYKSKWWSFFDLWKRSPILLLLTSWL